LENNLKDKNDSNKKGLTVLDLFLIFIEHRRRILIVTVFACILSIILYFFVLDLIYTSTASIKSSTTSTSLLGDVGIPDLGGGFDEFSLGGNKSAKELAGYEEILNSRRCLEPLITRFGLIKRDDHKYLEDALKDFRDNKLKIKIEKLSGIMFISVEDKDATLARDMVDFLVKRLDSINIELNVKNAKNNREFIEDRYVLAKQDLKNSEDSLKSYQTIYGIAPDLQVKAAAQTVFAIESELKAEEVKLDVLKKILSSEQPEVKTQEAKVNSLKSKVTDIQNSTDLTDLLRLGNSPHIVMNYLRLQREVEIQTKIVTFLLPLYEKAKIDENRDTPTIILLDKPYIAERKTKPKRLTMVIVWTFIGFLCTSIFFVVSHKWKHYKVILSK